MIPKYGVGDVTKLGIELPNKTHNRRTAVTDEIVKEMEKKEKEEELHNAALDMENGERLLAACKAYAKVFGKKEKERKIYTKRKES